MSTGNTRVATYLPEHLSLHLENFKSERGLKSDSKALILILNEFFNMTHFDELKSESLVAQILERLHLVEAKTESIGISKTELLDELKGELNDRANDILASFKGELLSELESKLSNLEDKLKSELLNELKSKPESDSLNQLDIGEDIGSKAEKASKSRIKGQLTKLKEVADGENILNTSQLADRLGIKANNISTSKYKYKNDLEGFIEWSREKDLEGHGWRFKSDSSLFYKVAH